MDPRSQLIHTPSGRDENEGTSLVYREGLSRRQFLAGLGALGLAVGGGDLLFGAAALPVEASIIQPRYVVLIVLDAFRPDYLDLAPMPALQSLIASGTSYDRAWVGQLESNTPAGHVSLSTGSLPKNTGVIGFEWRDPETGKRTRDGGAEGVLAGDLDVDLRESGVGSIALSVKSRDPAARIAAVSSEKVYAADGLGGWAADYILYHRRSSKDDRLLVPSAVPGHEPPADFYNQPNLWLRLPFTRYSDGDDLSTRLAVAAIKQLHPTVLMLNLAGADIYGHRYGGPVVPALMRRVAAGLDRNIARIIQAYKARGIYDQTLFAVTSDHGMIANSRTVSPFAVDGAIRRAGGRLLFQATGSAAYVYLKDEAKAAAVATQVSRLQGVTAAYFLRKGQDVYEYTRAPGTELDNDLDAAYQYLLGSFSGPRAPDVVAPFRENTEGVARPHAHGEHGGLSWGVQAIPLVLAGPGVKAGAVSHFPARLIDVAPTLLRLLDLPAPGMDGVVLADALTVAKAEEMASQTALSTALTAYQDALIDRSRTDIAADRKHRVHPPAPRPLHP